MLLIAAGATGQPAPVLAALINVSTPAPKLPALPKVSPTPVVTPPPGSVVPATVLTPAPVGTSQPAQPSSAQPSGNTGSPTSASSANSQSHSQAASRSQSPTRGGTARSAPRARYQSEYRAEEFAAQSAEQYRQQEASILAQLPALEAKYQALALAAGGGNGIFAAPELIDSNHPTPITQLFGCTPFDLEPYDPDCDSKHFHTGVDVAGDFDTPVFAPAGGVAKVFSGTTGYGNYIFIVNGNGFSTLLGHLDKLLVHDGDSVQRGDIVGLEGSTGMSTGAHLHFEIRYHNGFVDPCAFAYVCTAPDGNQVLFAVAQLVAPLPPPSPAAERPASRVPQLFRLE